MNKLKVKMGTITRPFSTLRFITCPYYASLSSALMANSTVRLRDPILTFSSGSSIMLDFQVNFVVHTNVTLRCKKTLNSTLHPEDLINYDISYK